jgi:hypothetical protein
MSPKYTAFIEAFAQAYAAKTFIKLALGNYHGQENDLKNIYIKPALIAGQDKLSFTFHYKTKDIVKNYSFEDAKDMLAKIIGKDFYIATLFTTTEEIIFENIHNKKFTLRQTPAKNAVLPSLEHNRIKQRHLETKNKAYLRKLGITDTKGNVLPSAQDKFKQIDKYIEIISPYLKDIAATTPLHIADMGAGKGYLTFALYDYLTAHLQQQVTMTGVEYRADLVQFCNDLAKEVSFDKLAFVEGGIADYQDNKANVLIALHACDTATDDALLKGIANKAELIVLAPCCHKQIRREMEAGTPMDDLRTLTDTGIFMERQAEMVTDTLRALFLQQAGYSTKIFEFISDAHTAKNVLIMAVKNKKTLSSAHQAKIRDEIEALKKIFGIRQHYLEKYIRL